MPLYLAGITFSSSDEIYINAKTIAEAKRITKEYCNLHSEGMSTIDYIERDNLNYNNYSEVKFRLNVYSGEITKISETYFPLPTPKITRLYTNEEDASGKIAIYWDAEGAKRIRVYWALDRNGPWIKHEAVTLGYRSRYFNIPEVVTDRIFYRIVTFTDDGRESSPSEVVEVDKGCCWYLNF